MAKVRGYLVILVAAVGIACGQAATPTAPSSVISQSTGFITSGHVQLNYRLDVPAHSAAHVSRARVGDPESRRNAIVH